MGNGGGIGPKVVQYARGKLNQQVLRGECYDLADLGLKKAGAKSAPDFGTITDDADYEWGTRVEAKDALPGDIVQFRDHEIEIETVTKTVTKKKDGSWQEETKTETATVSRPHHTAIVEENLGNGAFKILEQNVTPPGKTKPVRKVVRNRLHWKGSEGSKPKEITRKKDGSTVEKTVTVSVSVSGTIWVYRPQAK